LSGDRSIVVSRGLLRIVQERQSEAPSDANHVVYHVELEGEGILHTFSSLEMAMFELDAIDDSIVSSDNV